MIDFERRRKDVPIEEEKNWPKGAVASTHTFKDSEKRTVVDRKYFDNEEIAYLYQIRRNELVFVDGMELSLAETQAKEELLQVIYPNVDVVNFAENNQDLPDKCCRAIFTYSPAGIATFHIVHGEALKFYNVSVSGDPELGEKDDPLWGWDLTKPEEGFPCINLRENGCIHHDSGEKPTRCIHYPYFPFNIEKIKTCSYKFSILGNGRFRRTGNCNRCGVLKK